MGKWLTLETPGAIHVLPLDDLILHTHNTSCTCCPTVTLLGSTCCGHLRVTPMYTHNAMDGRD